jgi:hypothetical protein
MGQQFKVQERPLLQDYHQLRQTWKQGLLAEPSYHPLMQKTGKLFTLNEHSARFREPLPGRPFPSCWHIM